MYERKDIPSMNPEVYVSKCRVIPPSKKDACGAPATYRVVFSDDDKTLVCQTCAISLKQTAGAHGTIVRVEPLDGDK